MTSSTPHPTHPEVSALSRRSLLLPAAVLAVLLTTPALAQVFVHQTWIAPSFLAIAVAFGIGWVSRRLDVPWILAPALSVLGLVALLGIVFHAGTTAAGFPTSRTMAAIGESLSLAGSDIRNLAAPVTATPALTLLTTMGVFAVAAVVDVIVFRIRRPVAAGLPLLALFLVPTALAPRANAFAFALAAFGYLALLVAEGRDRARSWGRRLSGIDLLDDTADVSHVARVGRRIGTAAVGLALCVPLALPSVGKGIFDGGGGSWIGRGDGSRTAVVINPLVEIRGQLDRSEKVTLFTYTTDREPEYLRLTSLDDFDGEEWKLVGRDVNSDNRVGKGDEIKLPRELRDIPRRVTRQHVEITPMLDVRWLPVPYAPSEVAIESGDWRYEPFGLSVFSARGSSRNAVYDSVSEVPTPTPEQLRDTSAPIPESIREYTKIPPVTPPLAQRVVDELTGDKPNPYDKAVALNDYFFRSGGFTYSLENSPTGSGVNALEFFLKEKKGYCEQFAAAMAYLSRIAGIPARVVVGFTPGQPSNAGYTVSSDDAHAWPELYFPKTGWVRFEPTPRDGISVPEHNRTAPPSGQPEATPTAEPTPPPGESEEEAAARARQRELADDTAPPSEPQGPIEAVGSTDQSGVPVLPLALALAVVVLLTPTLVAAWTRRRRGSRAAGDHLAHIHAAWASLADAAEDAGHVMRRSDSPRAAGRRLVTEAALTGDAEAGVLRLAQAEERARYARTAPEAEELDTSVRAVRRALLAGLPKVARVRATVFPASSLRRIAESGRSVTAAVDESRTALARRASGLLRRRPRTA